jgi:hypothetical protein
MRDCLLTKCLVAYFAIVSLSLSSLLAQEVPKSDDESFDIEPPFPTAAERRGVALRKTLGANGADGISE